MKARRNDPTPSRLRRHVVYGTLLIFLALASLAAAEPRDSRVSGAADAPLLFEIRPAQPLTKASARALPRFARRQAPIDFRQASADLPSLESMTLDLFGRKARAVRAHARHHDGPLGTGRVEWTGTIPGDANASVHITVHQGVTVGRIETKDGYYEIRGAPGSGSTLVEIDLAAQRKKDRGCAHYWADLATGARPLPKTSAAVGTAGGAAAVTVDVLGLYDQAVLNKRPDAVAFLHSLTAQANDAFARSRIDLRLRLVHTEKMERGFLRPDDATRRRAWNDSVVTSLRARKGADLVAILTAEADTDGSIGIADIDGYVSLTAVETAESERSFTHELGHNFGALHNREDAYTAPATPPPNTFNYGFWHKEKRFRTVMSYWDPCPECVRINNFSNPGVLHDGIPTGVNDWIDNARKIRETMARVAAWTPDTWTLEVEKAGAGRVRSDLAGIDCGTDCRENAPRLESRRMTLTAFPDPGFVFKGWSGACAGAGACAVTLDGERKVTALFELDPANLSVALYDVDARRDVAPLTGTHAFHRDSLPARVTVQARLKSGAGSVRFELTGPQFRIFVANAAPFALYGSADGAPLPWASIPAGRFNLGVTAYSGPDASGSVLGTRRLVLEFKAPPAALSGAPLSALRPTARGLELRLDAPADLAVSLRDLSGREALALRGRYAAGTHILPWPSAAGDAVHLLRVESSGRTLHRGLVSRP